MLTLSRTRSDWLRISWRTGAAWEVSEMSNRRIQVHLGTAEDVGRRFVDAWRRAASGESVREEHPTFVDFKQMLGTLSDERLRLLKEVRREDAASVRELAERLHRDYKDMYDDVERLTAAGLLERGDGRLTAPYRQFWRRCHSSPREPSGLVMGADCPPAPNSRDSHGKPAQLGGIPGGIRPRWRGKYNEISETYPCTYDPTLSATPHILPLQTARLSSSSVRER